MYHHHAEMELIFQFLKGVQIDTALDLYFFYKSSLKQLLYYLFLIQVLK